MIQLHSQALVVCYPDGHMEPLDLRGIMNALLQSENVAVGTVEPWIMEHLLESVIYHFRRELEKGTVPFAQILELTQRLIHDFVQDQLGHPVVRDIDLFEVAHRSDAAFELDFFLEIKRLLVERTDSVKKERVASEGDGVWPLRITGLRRCAKFLAGRRRWSKRSSEVRDEILSYIREEAAKVKPRNLAMVVLS